MHDLAKSGLRLGEGCAVCCCMRHFFSLLILCGALVFGATSSAEAQGGGFFAAIFGGGANAAKSPKPGKHVEINLSEQMLRAYEGNRLVMKTRISSGKRHNTPTGRFRAGWKDADHYSSLFNNAPMPWSVQVSGNIFIHGFSVVPNYPASHGCIRMPLDGRNPAKRFFAWCDSGTPIHIFY